MEESWRRDNGGGIWDLEASEEASGRPLGSIWGASGRHLGGWGGHGRLRGHLGSFLVKSIVFYCIFVRDPPFYADETRASVTVRCKK